MQKVCTLEENNNLHFEYASVAQSLIEPNLLDTEGYEPPSRCKPAIGLLALVLLAALSLAFDWSRGLLRRHEYRPPKL
jgi:hypothetical protein